MPEVVMMKRKGFVTKHNGSICALWDEESPTSSHVSVKADFRTDEDAKRWMLDTFPGIVVLDSKKEFHTYTF